MDQRRQMGDFILTGSAQLDLVAGITQTLAGRVGRVELLPLSTDELTNAGQRPGDLATALFKGGYPALYDRAIAPQDWFANYIATYIERDVRQLIAVRDLGQFQTFVKMCAARTGQLLNLASLGADCGISAVAAWLLGIRDAATLETHAARGALFESHVVSELLKDRMNAGLPSDLYFWRDNTGNEVDVLIETTQGLQPIEIKSGATFAADWLQGLRKWQKLAGQDSLPPALVYGGSDSHEREGCQLLAWHDLHQIGP